MYRVHIAHHESTFFAELRARCSIYRTSFFEEEKEKFCYSSAFFLGIVEVMVYNINFLCCLMHVF